MARREIPTSLKEKGFKSFSQAIKEITGWDKKTFETQKRVMRMRVSNLNKLTGKKFSAIEELYYKVKYEDKKAYYESKGKQVFDKSPIQKALEDMTTTKIKNDKATKKQSEVASNYVKSKFEGLAKTYKGARDILDKLDKGEISIEEADNALAKFGNDMKTLKNEDPLTWASMQDEEAGSP